MVPPGLTCFFILNKDILNFHFRHQPPAAFYLRRVTWTDRGQATARTGFGNWAVGSPMQTTQGTVEIVSPLEDLEIRAEDRDVV
jgi:hypothetical protein